MIEIIISTEVILENDPHAAPVFFINLKTPKYSLGN